MSEAVQEAIQEEVQQALERASTVPPEEITPQLLPVLQELDLVENCRQLAREGWTIIKNAAAPEFVSRLRETILASAPVAAGGDGSEFMLLGKDPIYAEAALNPKVMAMAEFSVGRGFLLGSLISSIRVNGSPALALHADEAWFPDPLPLHNMMLTACWVTDEFTRSGGATRVLPGSMGLLRPPTPEETADDAACIAMECPAGSVVLWDGRVWHGNFARSIEGQRVVLHATYQRLLMRPSEDYSDVADDLIEAYGAPMSQLLGREDFLYKKHFNYETDYVRFVTAMNNARS